MQRKNQIILENEEADEYLKMKANFDDAVFNAAKEEFDNLKNIAKLGFMLPGVMIGIAFGISIGIFF